MGVLYKKKKIKLQGGGILKNEKDRNIRISPHNNINVQEYMISPVNIKDIEQGTPYYRNVIAQQDATYVDQPKIIPDEKLIPTISREEVVKLGLTESPVFSLKRDTKLIEDLNKVAPGRFSIDLSDFYDKYDKKILEAVNELKKEGESADPNIIKSIMLIETGMKPRKNDLGYEGFPQTKAYIVDDINNKFGTDFTMEDMYDPKQSAKFIHYYLKNVINSIYVNNLMDSLAAYNWGVGNLGKMRRGEKSMPTETQDYLRLANVILNRK